MHPLLLRRVPGPQLCQRHALPLPRRLSLEASRTAVVVHAKPTRAADFRDLSDDEIEKQVEDSKIELFAMRFKKARREAYKTDQIGWHKKKIAQLLTVKREREIANGINLREARRIQKKQNVEAGFPQY